MRLHCGHGLPVRVRRRRTCYSDGGGSRETKKGAELMFSAFIAGVGVGVLIGLGISALLAVAGKGGE